MKKLLLKIIYIYLLIVLISLNTTGELMAQIFFNINPYGFIELCPAASITLQADPLPSGYTYQWMQEDYGPSGCSFGIMNIPGATSQEYTASQTSVYWCAAIDSNGIDAGWSMNNAWVTSLSDPVPVCYTPPLNFCQPDSVSLSVNNIWGGPGTTGIQWQFNGTDIPSAVSFIYYAKTSGTYRCRVYNNCGFQYSNSIIVTANPKPSASITASGPSSFCSGSSVVLNALAGGNKSYQWKKGANIIPGATLSSYTATTGGNYRVTVTNTLSGCSKTTGTGTTVTVYSNPTASITPQGPTTFCAGDSVLLKAPLNNNYSYQWKKNNTNIPGATSNKLEAKLAGTYKVKAANIHGCSGFSNAVSVSVPCREEEDTIPVNNSFDVQVFPNPSSGSFTFETVGYSTDDLQIRIYDITGRLILHQVATHEESPAVKRMLISGEKMEAGIYSAVVVSGSERKVLKIIRN